METYRRKSGDTAKGVCMIVDNKDVPAMDCWHYIAPLIPVTSSYPESISIYVETFHAFQLLEAEQKGKANEQRALQQAKKVREQTSDH